jgi:hypothetical protein
MWPDQALFRAHLESLAADALREIGAAVAVQAVLVGFDSSNQDQPMLVEATDDRFSTNDLAEVRGGVEGLLTQREVSKLISFDPAHHAATQRLLRDRARATVVAQVLEATPAGKGWHFYGGLSAVVRGCEVHPVLGVEAKPWDGLPSVQWPDPPAPTRCSPRSKKR